MAYKAVLNGSSPYCAAKAGLAHFARCLAWELAPKAFDVFCVHPSNTKGTPMTEETIKGLMRYRGLDRKEAEAYWGAVLPKWQWLLPENIADLVSFLVSGKAEYLSGANLDMAGGQR
jgi:ketoreductase